MRVGLVCGHLDPSRDGVADYTRRLAAELRRAGAEPLVLTTHRHARDRAAVGVTHHWDVPGVVTAARVLRRLDLDVVHVQWAPSVFGHSRAVGLLPPLLPGVPLGRDAADVARSDDPDGRLARLRWLLSSYDGVLDALSSSPPDLLFSFHALAAFPVEVRRMLLDLGLDLPMVGYTHGSHWDPTDTFRFAACPGLEMLDLANLHVLDRVLLVSEQLRETLWDSVSAFNPALAKSLDAKYEVVGLPLDVARIDACRTDEPAARTTVVFNHAPVASKNPALFVRVMRRVLPRHDVQVLFTRRFGPGQAGEDAVAALAADFPDQVVLGDDLPLEDYYRALWQADLQVSTAAHESLGVSTLEAMHTGTCCVLPRLGSYPEITQDHPDVLYELGEGQLEERLTWFLDHPDRRAAVAADLQRSAARYAPEVVVGRIADVLHAV